MNARLLDSRTDPGVQVMKVQQPVFLVSSSNKVFLMHSDRSIGFDMERISTDHHLLHPSMPGSDSNLQEAAH